MYLMLLSTRLATITFVAGACAFVFVASVGATLTITSTSETKNQMYVYSDTFQYRPDCILHVH